VSREHLPQVSPASGAEGFDVYAYDQLGDGRSQRLSDVRGCTVARHVAGLEAIRVLLGREKLILRTVMGWFACRAVPRGSRPIAGASVTR
jgi:pimeloyl-ACP methyl ester carboxylesterase